MSGSLIRLQGIFVFYCWITNYHKFSGLEQIHLLSHSSVGQSLDELSALSARDLTRLKSCVCQAGLVSGRSEEESVSKLIQVVGSLQYLAERGWGLPISLLADGQRFFSSSK